MHIFKTGTDPKETCRLCGVTVGASRFFGWWTSCPGKLIFWQEEPKDYKYSLAEPYRELPWDTEVYHIRKDYKRGRVRGGTYTWGEGKIYPQDGWVIVDWGNEVTFEHLNDVVAVMQ